ncbi:MAG: type II CRISPR-associated endonuclease Cas1 [Treponemataceae bacterium]
MIKRTLFISTAVCLSMKNKQLKIRNKETDEENSIPIEDIGFVVIENNQVFISIPLINELAKNNTSVIFCDEKHMPCSMNLPLEGNSIQNQLFSAQIESSVPIKKTCWKSIVEQKIKNQALVLEKYGYNGTKLYALSKEVKSGDSTNREAVAAKIYWDTLVDKKWSRERFGEYPNNFLNYGYAILRAAMARALIGSGLLPTLGIHHHNKYDAFALANDAMEPYRPFIDDEVFFFIKENPTQKEVNTHFKKQILSVLTRDSRYEKITRPIMVGLSFTSCSLSKVLAGSAKKLVLPQFIA